VIGIVAILFATMPHHRDESSAVARAA